MNKEFFKGTISISGIMGKVDKRKRGGWSTPAWNDFTGKVWNSGDSDDARALVNEWVDKALGVLQNMWFTPSHVKKAEEPISKNDFVKNVDFVGEILAKHLSKPPNACKGLFILCVAAELGDDSLYFMKKKDLPAIINGSLKARLIALDVSNVNFIIQDLIKQIENRKE